MIALENAVEGCVREGYAAIVAALQARRAPAPAFRTTMAAIADDEAAHAQLAWDVDAWLRPHLRRMARFVDGGLLGAHDQRRRGAELP